MLQFVVWRWASKCKNLRAYLPSHLQKESDRMLRDLMFGRHKGGQVGNGWGLCSIECKSAC
jgi:hypothetical protein